MSSRLDKTTLKAYAAQCSYSITRMAKGKRMSRQHLRRCFLEITGTSPRHWVEAQRLDAAVRLLIEGKSVKEISIDLGYSDCSHFIRFFQRKFGRSPREFQRSCPNGNNSQRNVP